MKIIHVVLGKANPNRMNGVNKVVFEMAKKQTLSGLQVEVWGITKDVTQNYEDRPFLTRLFKASFFPFFLPKGLKKAIENENRGVMFHIHGAWIPVFSTIGKSLHRAKTPYVFTPHGGYNTIAMQRSAFSKKLYFALFESALIRQASTVHHIGQSESKGLSKMYAGKNITLLPYGFETSLPSVIRSQKGPFIIGFVGRLDIYTKGLDLMVTAFAKFLEVQPEAKLWVVGDSDERAVLEGNIKKLGIEGAVVLLGSKFGEEKLDLMRQMDAFVHPSRNEGLPASVLEAAALNIPCIVSAATNMGEAIEGYKAGICVPDENVEALTKAMIDVHADYTISNRVRTEGRTMVEERFSWAALLPEYVKMYAKGMSVKA